MILDVLIEATIEVEQGWFSAVFPPATPLQVDSVIDLLARLLPRDVDIESVQVAAEFDGHPVRRDEIVLSWERVRDLDRLTWNQRHRGSQRSPSLTEGRCDHRLLRRAEGCQQSR